MDTGPLDGRSITLGRCIVETEEDAFAGSDDFGDPPKQQGSDEAGLVPEGAEEIVVAFVVVAESGGTKPSGDGASALGEEEAAKQRQ